MPGPKKKPLTRGERDYQEILNVAPDIEAPPQDLATPAKLPPHPPQFRPEPMAVGDPAFARAVDRIMAIVPQLRGKVKSVTMGPTEGSERLVMGGKFPPDAFDQTNLMGVTDMNPGREHGAIGVNPVLRHNPTELDNTLAHEFTHAAGGNEMKARMMEEVFKNGIPQNLAREAVIALLKGEKEPK